MKSKKALSSVVQVSLLVVLAVISAVSYQTWFYNFESTTFTNIETKSGDLTSLNIELISSGKSFLLNSGPDNISMQSLLVNGDECYPSVEVVTGVNSLDIRPCIERANSSEVEITVITNEGLISETYFVDRDKVNVNPPVQIWNTTFDQGSGADSILDVALDSNDDIYLAIRASGSGETDFVTAKFYSNGTEAWRDVISNGASIYEGPESIAILNDEIFVAGRLRPGGSYNASLVHYDSSGTRIGIYYGVAGNTLSGIDFDSNNNVIGSSYGGLNKFNSSGSLLFGRAYSEFNSPVFWGVAVDNNDNYIIGGRVDDGSFDNSIVLKVNSSGDQIWNYTTRFWDLDTIWNLKTDSQNNIYAVGSSWEAGYGEGLGFILKLDSQGNQIYNVTMQNGTSLSRIDIFDNHLYITGEGTAGPTLFKYDLFGNLIWEYNPTGTGAAWGLGRDSSGNIIFVDSESNSLNIFKLEEN